MKYQDAYQSRQYNLVEAFSLCHFVFRQEITQDVPHVVRILIRHTVRIFCTRKKLLQPHNCRAEIELHRLRNEINENKKRYMNKNAL